MMWGEVVRYQRPSASTMSGMLDALTWRKEEMKDSGTSLGGRRRDVVCVTVRGRGELRELVLLLASVHLHGD